MLMKLSNLSVRRYIFASFVASISVLIGWSSGATQESLSEILRIYGEDYTIPAEVSYVSLDTARFIVEKPFPIIYFTDQDFETQRFAIQYNIKMAIPDLDNVFRMAQELSCLSDADIDSGRKELIVVTSRRRYSADTQCYIDVNSACYFIDRVKSKNGFGEVYDLGGLANFSRRIGCS